MPTYLPNHTLLNRYRIERFIGAGAFAEVYLATHLKLNAPYALKILNKDVPGLGSTEFGDYRQRFQFEAQLGAALRHPHIVHVYDFEEEGETLILRMAYAAGGSLDERLKDAQGRRQALAVGDAVRIAQEIAQGLAALHEMDAVHRDVKPSNILFDDKGRAMLADLGLAQAPGGPSMRSVMSQAMSHPGTPAYMSPEQAGGFSYLTPQSDVYTLGAGLFEMVTGRVYKSVRPGTRVRKLRKGVPEWLDDLLVQMLAKDPGDRPWDGAEVAELLERQGGNQKLEIEEAETEIEKPRSGVSDRTVGRGNAEPELSVAEKARREAERRRHVKVLQTQAESAQQKEDWSQLEELSQKLQALDSEAAKPFAQALEEHQREKWEQLVREEEKRLQIIALQEEGEIVLLEGKDWSRLEEIVDELQMLKTDAAIPFVVAQKEHKVHQKEHKRREEERQKMEEERAKKERKDAEQARKNVEEDRAQREREEIQRSRQEAIEQADQALRLKLNAIKMVFIPAGEFIMGSDKNRDSDAYNIEFPQHQVYVDAFEISKYPVTNEQYAVFVQDMGWEPPSHWAGGVVTKINEKYPVVNVSWHDASAYCQWLCEKTALEWRLPSEAEWEKAARSTAVLVYPWGDMSPNETLCNFDENVGSTTPVDKYPKGASPYGVMDMAGNIEEWTRSLWGASFLVPDYRYPYDSDDGREDSSPTSRIHRVIRGCTWKQNHRKVRAAHRVRGGPLIRTRSRGFRIVRSP